MKAFYMCLIMMPLVSVAQDFSLYKKKEFVHGGDSLPYRILFPEGYDDKKNYPLVVLLHGGGERGADNEKQLTHGASLFLEPSNRTNFPSIVVVPQCPESSYWASVKFNREKYPLVLDFSYQYPITPALQLVEKLVQSIIKDEGVDKKRVYMMGLSMGGMGTLEAIYRFPKLFAGAIAICGGGDVDAYGARQARIPIWLFHGTVDGVIEVRHSREMYDRLQELNAQVKYKEYEGVNHNSWENAFKEPDLLPWLFAQHR